MDNGASHAPCRPYQLAFAGFKESRLFSKFVSAALASSLSIGICRRLAAFETGAISPVRENRRAFAYWQVEAATEGTVATFLGKPLLRNLRELESTVGVRAEAVTVHGFAGDLSCFRRSG